MAIEIVSFPIKIGDFLSYIKMIQSVSKINIITTTMIIMSTSMSMSMSMMMNIT